MIKAGMFEELPALNEGASMMMRIAVAGLQAVGGPPVAELADVAACGKQESREGQQASTAAQGIQGPPVAPSAPPQPRTSFRDAAMALLAAWDAGVERSALPVSIEALRAALGRGGANGPSLYRITTFVEEGQG